MKWSNSFLKWIIIIFIGTVWISAGLFGLYILAFYASPVYRNNLQQWNNGFPGLYVKGSPANIGIGFHFEAGALILMMGSIQLIRSIRIRFPVMHRWVGRVYIVSSLIAAIGGLIFIIINGTYGGRYMNIGFGLYGILMLIAAVQTYLYAVKRKFEKHREWALRLFALAIGSWLYRIDFGFGLCLQTE